MTSTSTGETVRVADTSFLYALFSRSDLFHARAVRAAASAQPIAIPAEIMSETIALIHYRQTFDVARAAGEWIRAQPHIEVGVSSPSLLEAAWSVFARGRGRMSYPDSVVVAWCRPRGFVPLAYDSRILAEARK